MDKLTALIKRFRGPEWTVLGFVILGPVFYLGDAEDLAEKIVGRSIPDSAFFATAIIATGITALIQMTRLRSQVDERMRYRRLIDHLNQFLKDGNGVMDSCGRPKESYRGADPLYWQQNCLPTIGNWIAKVQRYVEANAPEYSGQFSNDGQVFRDTEVKPVAVQQLEGRLNRLEAIVQEMRNKAC